MNNSKTYTIVQVKTILGIDRPIVVYVTSAGVDIARTPKQALLDLQNSFRGLGLDPNMFNRGLGAVGVAQLGAFKKELGKLIGATVTGEIKPFKAGDTFVYSEGHPALTDKTHELYNKVKLGDKGVAEKDGVWVEGFLSIPQTQQELLVDSIADKTAGLFATMFGMSAPVAQQTIDTNFEEPTEEEVVSNEAVGNTAKPK